VKAAIGKLTVTDDLRVHVIATGVRLIVVSAEHGLAVAKLPLLHRAPFDRLLVAQAGAA
jgi:PIN domain nuclease of toxin-antitoxin system